MKLFVVLLLLGMFSLSVAEVVDSFKKDCPQFFFKNNNRVITPTVFTNNKYKQICQFYEGEYWFATLYDTKFKIPVYSAYTYSFIKSRDIKDDYWKIEPQLEEKRTNNNKEMKQLKPEEEEVLRFQAQNKDYKDSGYTKGHVFPKSYGQSDQQKESTFTLTNAAPKTQENNTAWGEQVEIPMLNEIKGNCDQNVFVYIVTGVVPGDNTWLPIKRGGKTIKQGVNIPRYFWAAYSCKSKNNNNIESNAYIADQSTALPPENLTVDRLNIRLTKLYNVKQFSVFG
uniref:Endonuclease domain-containing 1 protein-like n=1 Tax=Astyanax mexicanus TaxID=7994 RepID=A0A3B1KKY0_ASTMX